MMEMIWGWSGLGGNRTGTGYRGVRSVERGANDIETIFHRKTKLGGVSKIWQCPKAKDCNASKRKKRRDFDTKKRGTEKKKNRKRKYRVILTTATSCEYAGYLSLKLKDVEPSGNGTSNIVRTSTPLLKGVGPFGNTKRR